jgi:hypothetical protein
MPIVDGEAEFVPGHRPIDDTDLEISYNMRGRDLILRVNKAGIMVFRVLLENAGGDLSGEKLATYSTFAPDFAFKVGDTLEGMARLARTVGLPISGS